MVNMSDIVLFARIIAKPGSEEEMAGALTGLVAASEEESGLRVYAAHRQDDEPATFWFYEVYDDEDAHRSMLADPWAQQPWTLGSR
jgi:quinol monooxygenase YgiN